MPIHSLKTPWIYTTLQVSIKDTRSGQKKLVITTSQSTINLPILSKIDIVMFKTLPVSKSVFL